MTLKRTETCDVDDVPRLNIILTCPFCHTESRVDGVPTEGYFAWRSGIHIQSALPGLTPAQQETLMTGSHEGCFDRLADDEHSCYPGFLTNEYRYYDRPAQPGSAGHPYRLLRRGVY